ncbi:hypothetical protein RI543_003238 [Arxiozyma heterogenica]|uniref:Uncharacterized protein n=1 Tax=Arxiozyma heterogenica TaxID=278026 RepID=A0AAN7WPU8_9SACH|nr:hypothetical protein RI543_003238 [Kazachstania heterogenica]
MSFKDLKRNEKLKISPEGSTRSFIVTSGFHMLQKMRDDDIFLNIPMKEQGTKD